MAERLLRRAAVIAAILLGLVAGPGFAEEGKGSIRPGKPRPEAPSAPGDGDGGSGSVEGDPDNGWAAIAQGRDPRLLQLSLIWTGHFTGTANGKLDEATKQAIIAFQKSLGDRANGQLTDAQFVELLKQSSSARARVGWTTYANQELGYRVGYPAVVLTKARATENGGRMLSSADDSRRLEVEVLDPMSNPDFKKFFETIRAGGGSRQITRAEFGGTYFVFEGSEGSEHFVGRVEQRAKALVGFSFFYPASEADAAARVVNAVANEFFVPEVLGPPEPAPPDTVAGLYGKSEARPGVTPSNPDTAGPDEPTTPPRPDTPTRPDRPQVPPVADQNDQVPLPTLPMAVATQTLDPAGVFQKVKDAVWVVVAAPMRGGQPYLDDGYSQGSAVAVSAQHLFTNCHVLENQQFFGIFRNEDMSDLRPVTLKLQDVEGDRCIIRVDKPDLPSFVTIRSHADVVVGERAYTIGAPSGLDLTLGEGLVSAKRRHEGQQYVQTSAPISPGSSGGGLFDSKGNLLGITTFMLRDTQNLNFAIAAEEFLRPGPTAGAR
ncbi:serine protease [Oleomonas cavernae]|nr:serine protease [Oleomonas cavernae]